MGVVPSSIDIRSLKPDTSGLPDRMTMGSCFNMAFDPNLGTCWVQIDLGSKQICTEDRWLTGADTFLSRNLGSWYTGLRLDKEKTLLLDYYATLRHIVFSVY